MTTLKHGDTDGTVTFRFRNDAGPISLNQKTAFVKFTGTKIGAVRTIQLTISTPDTLGEGTWVPSDADYAVLVPDLYNVEGHTLNGDNKKRTAPTIGVIQINIEPTL